MFFLAMLVLLLGTPKVGSAQYCWLFSGTLSGDEVVPPSPSSALLVVGANFSSCTSCPYDEWDEMQFDLGYLYHDRHLEGVPFLAEIRSGKRGENGPALYEIPISRIDYHTWLQFDAAHCAALMDTSLYVIVATDLYPEGEVRSQLIPIEPTPTLKSSWGRIRGMYR